MIYFSIYKLRSSNVNYRQEFERCFEWIDLNLKENITLDMMAEQMGYSVYHFCRIFYFYQGTSPMEYLLSRRVQAALVELHQGKKIINVAFDYGFESSGGFTKAIKKKYGHAPSKLKKLDWNNKAFLLDEQLALLTTIREIEKIHICGYAKEKDFQSKCYKEDMVAYWTEFEEKNLEQKLYNSINPSKHGEIGILIREDDHSGKHSYLLGVMGKSEGSEDSWKSHTIPGGRYLVVTTPPVDMLKSENELAEVVRRVWKYLFEQWFETAEYEIDETREAFEYYDERCHYRKDAVMDIYIPVKSIK